MPSTPRDNFDSAWKEALTDHLPSFFDFFYPQLRHMVLWDRPIRFLDKERKALGPPYKGRAGKRVVDVLVELPWKNEGMVLVLVHIEVQSQKDPAFAERLFYYHARLSERYDRPLMTLVILADPDSEWRPRSYGKSFAGTRLTFEFPTVKLRDYKSQLYWLTYSRNPFALLTAATLHAQAAKADSAQREDSKFQLVKALYRLGLARREVLGFFRLIDGVLTLSEERRKSFQSRVENYEKEMDMPYITSVERSGIEKGLAEGQRAALLEGLASVLQARFGRVATDFPAMLIGLDVEELKRLLPLAATDGCAEQFRARLP